ncbi:MAG: hypothetical protein ACK47M_19995, partial [Caldilinea sp.]
MNASRCDERAARCRQRFGQAYKQNCSIVHELRAALRSSTRPEVRHVWNRAKSIGEFLHPAFVFTHNYNCSIALRRSIAR